MHIKLPDFVKDALMRSLQAKKEIPISFQLTHTDKGVEAAIDMHANNVSIALAFLLNAEILPRVRRCPAPKLRSTEICDRWFLGRPDQIYCSSQCQVRRGSRNTRERYKQGTAKKRQR